MSKLKSPAPHVALDAVGYVLFTIGAFVTLASHDVHDRIVPFLTQRFPHWVEIAAGAAVALVGIAVLVISDKLKRRRKEAEPKAQA